MTIKWKRSAKIFRSRWLMQSTEWCKGFDDGHEVGLQDGTYMLYGVLGAIAMGEAIRKRCTCPVPFNSPEWPRTPNGRVLDWSDVCERCKGYP